MRAATSIPALALLGSSLFVQACGGCRDGDVVDQPDPVVDEEPHDIGQYLSMRTMPDGKIAASYHDRTKGGLTFALLQDDGSWKEERIDGFPDENGLNPGTRGLYTSLAIAADGTAWVSYYDATNGNLFYARRGTDGGDAAPAWETGVGDIGGGATPNSGQFSSLALDGNDQPVIAHYDANRQSLRVAHWNDTSFTGEVVDEGEDFVPTDTGVEPLDANVGKYARLLIHEGTEYIAYYDAALGDLKLAVGNAGNYSIEVVDSDGDVGAWPSMAFDGSDLLIAYQDVGNQDLLLARNSGGTWTTELVDDGDFVGADAELFLNGSYPAIVYFDGNENNLKLAQSTGSEWTLDTLGGADAALGFHNETVLSGNTRMVGCYDYTNRTIWMSEL